MQVVDCKKAIEECVVAVKVYVLSVLVAALKEAFSCYLLLLTYQVQSASWNHFAGGETSIKNYIA